MKWAFLTSAMLAGTVASAAAQGREQPIALVGGTIVDGSGGAAVPDGVIVIEGDRIVAVGPRASVSVPKRAKVVDISGKWVTPGLIDAHVHFFQSGGLYTRPDALDLRSVVPHEQDVAASKARLDETFARYLASGVTTVVDAGGPMWNFEVRERARSSSRAPRVAVAGPLIATEPTPEQKKLDHGDPPIISAATPADARRMAVELLIHKPDFIKIWGIGSGPEGAARVREMTRAVAEVAHAANVRVAVHATSLEIAQAALDGGADILVHSVGDMPVNARFIAAAKASGTVYVTTNVVLEGYNDALRGQPELLPVERALGAPDVIATLYETPAPIVKAGVTAFSPAAVQHSAANSKTLADAGVRVAAGTDAGNIGTLHGPAIHRELQLLARAGLTPAQVLSAATRDAAYAYSAKPDVGLVATGYRADLLVLDADPLVDSANLSRIAAVWSRGRGFEPAELIEPAPEAIVQLQLDRANARDLEGFLATYAEDAELFDLPGASIPVESGKTALRAVYGEQFARYPEMRCRVAQRIVEGNFVIDQEVCATDTKSPPVNAAAIYQVESGRIRRVWFAAPEPTAN